MDNTALQEAINSLALVDVFTRSLSVSLKDSFDPKYSDAEIGLQWRYGTSSIATYKLDDEDDPEAEPESMVRFVVDTGVRFVKSDSAEAENAEILATIEAEFCAEYRAERDLSREALEEFGQSNALYHVWPYWRELVHSAAARFRLPPLVLPTYRVPKERQRPTGEENAAHETADAK